VEVRRTADKSLITVDRIRVDVELEFYVRVQPTVEGIATAAQAIGSRAFNPEGIRNLLEGRFVDALQAVAAAETMDSLHERRGEFVRHVAEQLRENLSVNGVLLDSVSLTRLDQASFAALDENNAFNAVGMRKLAEIIASTRKQRTEIEAHADIAVRQTLLEATKRRLLLQQEEELAQSGQRLEIEKIKAASDADAARAREQAMVATENARIERERETSALEIGKQRELRKLEIEAQLNSELRKVDSAIQLAAKHAEEAKAQAGAERLRAEIVMALEHVQTERERAVADRSREMAAKRVQEEGEVASANADTEAGVLIRRAQAEAQATRARAEAERARLLAESEGSTARIKAENSRTEEPHAPRARAPPPRRRRRSCADDRPAEKIESIRIHQVTGLGGAPGSTGGESASRPPVNQVMDSILGMALQLPALKSIGESIGYDFSGALPKSGGPDEGGKKTP
jgi:uncharacterized membrane protein YqiK